MMQPAPDANAVSYIVEVAKYKVRLIMFIDNEEKELISKLNLQQVDATTFYRTVFPKGSLERLGEMQSGMYNAMVTAHWANGERDDILCVHDDLSLLTNLRTMQATMNCVSYIGNAPDVEYARNLYAFFVKVNMNVGGSLFEQFLEDLKYYLEFGQLAKKRPQKGANGKYTWLYSNGETMDFIRPTYLVMDNHKLYLCFVMKRPIPLFENYKKRLQAIYNDISKKVNEGLHLPPPRPESILTPRTVVGSCSLAENGGTCRAFRFPDNELSIVSQDALNSCVAKHKQLHIKHPEDYQWECSPKMFDWFLKLVKKNADNENLKPAVFVTVAAYAIKSGITDYAVFAKGLDTAREELKHRFTAGEIIANISEARYMYLNQANGLRRRTIDYLREESGIFIPKNKRNGKKQAVHCRELNNQKKVQRQVLAWMKAHPDARKIDCARALGISPSTVTKWTKSASDKPKAVSSKNICPECGAAVVRRYGKPWFNTRLGVHRQRVDKFCSNSRCQHKKIPLGKTYRNLDGECMWTEDEKWKIIYESKEDKRYLLEPQFDEEGFEVVTQRRASRRRYIPPRVTEPKEIDPDEIPF